jgi:hypothetical protein
MFAGHPEEDYYTNESKWTYKFNQTYTIDKSLNNFILQIQDFLHVFYPIDIYLEDFLIEDFLNISLNSSSITHSLGMLEKYLVLYLNDGNLSIGQSDEFINYLSYLNGTYFINSSVFESIFIIEPSDFKFSRNIESSFHGTLFSELSFDFNLDEKLGTKFRGNVIFNISMEITLNENHAIEYIKYYALTDFEHDSDSSSGFQRTGTGFERILVYQEIKTLEPPTIPSFPLITLGLIIIASTGFNFKKMRRKSEIS